MANAKSHYYNAKTWCNNFIACTDHEKGNVPGQVHSASLAVEHLLKAIIAAESPNDDCNLHGHNLGKFLQRIDSDVSEYEALIYDLDGMNVASRYDRGFETEMMKDAEAIQQRIQEFIRHTSDVIYVLEKQRA